MVSGVEFSDSSLTYNTQCSSPQVSFLMPFAHLAHPPPPDIPPASFSLFSAFKSLLWFTSLSVFFLMFIIFERERETECEQGRGRERGRHRIRDGFQALSCQHRAQHGAWTHEPPNHDLSRSRTLHRLSHPGAPHIILISTKLCVIISDIHWESDMICFFQLTEED